MKQDEQSTSSSSEQATEGSNNQTTDDRKQADRLVDLITKNSIDLFPDQYDEPYATINQDEKRYNLSISSKKFKQYLRLLYSNRYNGVADKNSLSSAIEQISAIASFNPKRTLFCRVAEDNGSYSYNLCKGKSIRICKEGWGSINSSELFKNYSHQKEQISPASSKSEDVYKIFNYIKVRDEDLQLLILAWFVTGLIPNIPHPILQIYGEKGSSKTTISKIIKEILDPSSLSILSNSNNKKEFTQQASHHWVLPLDNLSSIPDWLSDMLCRICTGEGFSKRMLYTDDDDIIYSFKRCIVVNSINILGTKSDLLDRSILLELERIEPNLVKTEKKLWHDFEQDKPIILGSLFQILSRAIGCYEQVELRDRPRMADFAEWGCAVALALGYGINKFMGAYSSNIRQSNSEAIDSSPTALTVVEFMKDKQRWQGTATDLVESLVSCAESIGVDTDDKQFPRSNRIVWTRLKEVKSNLRGYGIRIIKDAAGRGSSTGRTIILEKIEDE